MFRALPRIGEIFVQIFGWLERLIVLSFGGWRDSCSELLLVREILVQSFGGWKDSCSELRLVRKILVQSFGW